MRFMTAWIGFNALYSHMNSTVDGDWNQVKKFAEDDRLAKVHQMLLELADLPDYAKSVGVFGAQGVRNVKSGVRRTISDKKALLEVLGCVYQARCNCVHGGKHMADERDRSLVTAGFVITANLLSYYLSGTIVGGWDSLLEKIERQRQLNDWRRTVSASRILPERH